ncbi:hypothetical protein [Taibaiella soli]|uniref:N-acetyltransferase n=1 Tax=Taibaiella soli TaxID=1649169 RepID=A0A2W2AX93_9BACT|nr:hypothetical protein [Taibaiella soli]PZF72604.1 hypothetical protein DN068_12115 [Taibaiella soli]
MKIEDVKSGNRHDAVIVELEAKDYEIIKKSKRFYFTWKQEDGKVIYKLCRKGDDTILGLMSLIDHPENFALEIGHLCASKENVGKNKQYSLITGCLIAYACREAFKKGYGGYVYLKPKDQLKKHYHELYGMDFTGIYMVTEEQNSARLIKKYIEGK